MSVSPVKISSMEPSYNLILRIILTIWCYLVRAIFYIKITFFPDARTFVVKAKDVLLTYSAMELVTKIRKKELRCQDVVNAYIRRLLVLNTQLNAVLDERFDAARMEAEHIDKILDKFPREAEAMPLLGVPITIKASIAVKGLHKLNCCSVNTSAQDAEVVALLKKAGAIILCTTTSSEYCLGMETYNKVTGMVGNPYDLRKTSGGSSGGEAALISSGGSVFGIGSDACGDVRIPCAFTGLFGHKPTINAISLDGHSPSSDYLCLGLMCRSAEDLPFLTTILSPSWFTSPYVDASDLIIYPLRNLPSDFGVLPIQDAVERQFCVAVEKLRKCKCRIEENAPFTELKLALELTLKLHYYNSAPDVLKQLSLAKETQKFIRGKSDVSYIGLLHLYAHHLGKFVISGTVKEHVEYLDAIRASLIKIIGSKGVLLLPTFPTVAPPLYCSWYALSSTCYCGIFNLLGFPATTIPIGMDVSGLPIGVQAVAAPFMDKLCFAVARELEAQLGGFEPSFLR